MIQSPIAKVLSLIRTRRVRALVLGGQACVFYGAAEFSRDLDLAIGLAGEDLARLQQLLEDLEARPIAVPPFAAEFLEAGQAVHFRCKARGVEGLRVDVLHSLRGMEGFEALWARRTTVTTPEGLVADLVSLPDLVKAKKTQRDRDWPMIRRLIESSYYADREKPSPDQLRFWLLEGRTPEILIEISKSKPVLAKSLVNTRPLLSFALRGNATELERQLAEEERLEKALDREYWRSLKKQLERIASAPRVAREEPSHDQTSRPVSPGRRACGPANAQASGDRLWSAS